MRAYVIEQPGGPEALVLRDIPRPHPRPGWVLIAVKAFGLNRSEHFTRIGDSPTVKFPRVLGIECVGEVVDGGGDLKAGQKVAALMGGMGREFDGSYAEYTLVPRRVVFPIETALDWAAFGALPEMLQTIRGSLDVGLEVERAKTLLIRGGTSSIGLAGLALAQLRGIEVVSTTRSERKAQMLKDRGAAHVVIDAQEIAQQVRAIYPGGVDRVLELIGTTTLCDSMRATRPGGIVCMTGILGGRWSFDEFQPMRDIPSGVKLTCYSGGAQDITAEQLQSLISSVEAGELTLEPGPVFAFDALVEAHRAMDENRANGKIVIRM